MTLAEVTGDGRQDVAAASGAGTGSLTTWHGLADGSFRAAGRYENPERPDEERSSYAGGEVAVLIGGGAPALHRMEIEGIRYGPATADFDGDGRVDLAVANDAVDQRQCFA